MSLLISLLNLVPIDTLQSLLQRPQALDGIFACGCGRRRRRLEFEVRSVFLDEIGYIDCLGGFEHYYYAA